MTETSDSRVVHLLRVQRNSTSTQAVNYLSLAGPCHTDNSPVLKLKVQNRLYPVRVNNLHGRFSILYRNIYFLETFDNVHYIVYMNKNN